jgi:ubiquinone biosynthesis protein
MKNLGRAVWRLFYLILLSIKYAGGYLISRKRISGAVRLRFFFQEAGGGIIKVGQIIAMRVDFLSEEYVQELMKLLDEVPPFDCTTAKEIVELELRAPLGDLFKDFEPEPLSAASFGQVHAATLPSGDHVVVKVQRPGVRETVAADLTLFRLGTFLIDATGLHGGTGGRHA